MNHLYERLKEFRLFLGYRQTDMAVIMGSSLSTYKRYETGQSSVPIECLDFAVNKHNLNLHWLLTGEGEMLRDQSEKDQEVARLRSKIKRIEEEIDELAARRRGRPGEDNLGLDNG